jgi:hypothetical protein
MYFLAIHHNALESLRFMRISSASKELSEFNYKFMSVDNNIDWNEYVTQLETAAKQKPSLREGIYLEECKKQPKQQEENTQK